LIDVTLGYAEFSPLPTAMSVIELSEADRGGVVRVVAGSQLQLELNEPATAGYRWHSEVTSPDVLTLMPSDELEHDDTPGALRRRRFTYVASSPGTAELSFQLQRPWESTAIDDFVIRINVAANDD
jgi:predicted secreted protein